MKMPVQLTSDLTKVHYQLALAFYKNWLLLRKRTDHITSFPVELNMSMEIISISYVLSTSVFQREQLES
jgi:hypothetical protein